MWAPLRRVLLLKPISPFVQLHPAVPA
ncbi:MAG: hypothetical protein RLZZ253_2101, partial [Verrucomicrobiota bacterium]